MAQSRLEKIGTIFTRTTGLLRAGAMKAEDKPLWYNVYAAFPPKLEPRFDRPPVNVPIRNIFYAEDVVRAKYHRTQSEMISLADTKHETRTQQFIEIFNVLKAQGALDEEQIFNTAQEVLAARPQTQSGAASEPTTNKDPQTQSKEEEAVSGTTIDIKSLFKE